MVSRGGRLGYELLLAGFWRDARRAGINLPTAQPVSASAFCQARDRLEPEAIRKLLHIAATRFETDHGADHRWRGRRVLAVDGSRCNTQRSAALHAAFGAPPGGHCPQVSVSTLFDVIAKVPLDVSVGRFGMNERRELVDEHLRWLESGDIVVLDRGYPSYETLSQLRDCPADFVVRAVTKSGFPAVAAFVATGERDAEIEITVPTDYRNPSLPTIAVRAVRIERGDSEPTVVLTSLDASDVDAAAINELYRLRWEVEEYYKLIKSSYLGQGQFHSKKPAGVRQEIYAMALFVSISRHLMAGAARERGVAYADIGQKTAMLAVAADVTRILLDTDPAAMRQLLGSLCAQITRNLKRKRHDRAAPRRSYKPPSKWTPQGRRGDKRRSALA